MSKLFEKKLEMGIRAIYTNKKLISPPLFGLQPGYSTKMARNFITEITKGLNKRMLIIAVLLDFRAAFSTLLYK